MLLGMFGQSKEHYVFARLSAHTQISAQPLFFTVRGGTASAKVLKGLVKLPPGRSMKS